jgi:hypothetical protein
LIDEAVRVGVHLLGITDHDTFAGYDAAVPLARQTGLELVCGIELSNQTARPFGPSAGLFPDAGKDGRASPGDVWKCKPSAAIRNIRLIATLQSLGFDITLEEVQTRGRGLTSRRLRLSTVQ